MNPERKVECPHCQTVIEPQPASDGWQCTTCNNSLGDITGMNYWYSDKEEDGMPVYQYIEMPILDPKQSR